MQHVAFLVWHVNAPLEPELRLHGLSTGRDTASAQHLPCCCCACVHTHDPQVVQYAALLGPWPTQVPDANNTWRSVAPPPAPPSAAWSGPLEHMHSAVSNSHNGSDNSEWMDSFALYRSILHPPGWLGSSANSSNTPRVQFVSSSATHAAGAVGCTSNSGDPPAQLLLWSFLGLAAVQPLVVWLQAAALAVVLNVLRHMPQQQLQYLLSSYFSADAAPAGVDSSLAGRGQQSSVRVEGRQCSDNEAAQQYQLFLPLSYAWRGQWSWLDWARFRLLKHSLDILLVSVVALMCLMLVVVDAGLRVCTLPLSWLCISVSWSHLECTVLSVSLCCVLSRPLCCLHESRCVWPPCASSNETYCMQATLPSHCCSSGSGTAS